MTDTVFRTKSEPVVESAPQPTKPNGPVPSQVKIEVPYNSYTQEHGHSYLVDHYGLGDSWEVFNDEIGTIDGYLKSKIESGETADSQKAIKKIINDMEKMNNIKDEERSVVRIGVLSSYIKFLMSKDEIKQNTIKYGTK